MAVFNGSKWSSRKESLLPVWRLALREPKVPEKTDGFGRVKEGRLPGSLEARQMPMERCLNLS
jgi:hypothetical protein